MERWPTKVSRPCSQRVLLSSRPSPSRSRNVLRVRGDCRSQERDRPGCLGREPGEVIEPKPDTHPPGPAGSSGAPR